MNGSVELYKAAKKHGIKPLIGLEAYFVDDRHVRDRKVERNHLTLLARATTASATSSKLSSAGFLEGLHRGKPGVDLELLAAPRRGRDRADGLPGPRGRRRIVDGRLDGRPRAPRRAGCRSSAPRTSTSRSSRNGIAEQEQVNEAIARFASEMGRPLVATADVHYLRREDYHHHAALLCVQTKCTLAQPKMSFDTNEFYLKCPEEMAESFADMPEAPATTLEIAERCDVTIELGHQLIPRFDCPDGKPSTTTCASWSRRGCASATAPRRRPRRSSGWRWSSASSTRWASTPTS